MHLYYGSLEEYNTHGHLSNKIFIDKNNERIWYRRIGNQSSKFQIHSVLLLSLQPDTEYKLILNVNGVNVTELADNKGPFSQGSTFKTFPANSDDIKKDPVELMMVGNMPSDGKLPDKYYTQTIDALLSGGNAIKDGGEMSCLFLWSEFFKVMNVLRTKSHNERLIPFAMGAADGELGFNINSRFAAEGPEPRKTMIYNSNQIFGKKTAETLGSNFQKIPLYRFFFPL